MNCNFRDNLKNELHYQGVTVKELSARTGIPVATLDCYLGTRSTVPSVYSAIKIAHALQITVEQLVDGKKLNTEKSPNKSNRENQEIIRWVERLHPEQSGAILKLIKIFKGHNTKYQ